MNNFSNNLYALRLRENLLPVDLEQKTGIPKKTIDYYELDVDKLILDHLITLADFFGVSIDDLVRGDCSEVQPKKKSKWLINSLGDAVKLSDVYGLYKTKNPIYSTETEDFSEEEWQVFASCYGERIFIESFETKDEANAYIRELVNRL